MTLLKRNVTTTQSYTGGETVTSKSTATLEGDVEIAQKKLVTAGASVSLDAAVDVSNLLAIYVVSDKNTVVVSTNVPETILALTKKVILWESTSGETNPLTTDFTDITIDNTGGAEDAVVEIRLLTTDS